MKHDHLPLFNCNVISIVPLAPVIVELSLTCPKDFKWQSGDYIWLGLTETDMKPFSIANLPSTSSIECHIALTDVMRDWINEVRQSSVVYLRGPVPQFHWPVGNSDIILVAGGTGITPLYSLLSQHIGQQSNRNITLYWGVRNLTFAYINDAIKALTIMHPLLNYYLVMSDPDDDWQGFRGVFPDFFAENINITDDVQWLVCGPWPMVSNVKAWLQTKTIQVNIQT